MNVNKKKTNLKTKADSREKKRRKGFKEDIKHERKPTKQKKNQNWVCLILKGYNYVKRSTSMGSLYFTLMLKQKICFAYFYERTIRI